MLYFIRNHFRDLNIIANIDSCPSSTMRFAAAVALASTASLSLMPTVAADWWGVDKRCLVTGCTGRGDWHTSYGATSILWKDGCQTRPGVPYMEWLCVDWKQARLSFKFEGQGQRCMLETYSETENCGLLTCSWLRYDERPCTWRLAVPESAVGNATAAAETTPAVQARAFIA